MSIIDDFNFNDVHQGSIEINFSVEMIRIRHITGEDEELKTEKIMLFLFTDIARIDYGGLEKGKYINLTEHTLNTINLLASHVRRWLNDLKKQTVNFFEN